MKKRLTLLAALILILAVRALPQNTISNTTVVDDTSAISIRHNMIADSLFANRSENVFKFKVDSKEELFGLTFLISIDDYDPLTKEVTAYANKQEFLNFLKQNISYQIVQSDNSWKTYSMATTLADFMTTYNFARYPTYSVYDQFMSYLVTTYPTICQRYDLGVTPVKGHKIIALKVTSNVSTKAPKIKVLYSSSLHGDEVCGYVTLCRFINYLCVNAAVARVKNILDNIELWFIPDQNPDGTYATNDNSVAPSPTSTRANANSVDMNRNFPCFVGGPHTDGKNWQYEVLLYKNFLDTSNFTFSLQYHGGGEVLNYYYDTYKTVENNPTDANWWIYEGAKYVNNVRNVGGQGATAFTSVNAQGYVEGGDWYYVFGGNQDYANYYSRIRFAYLECSTPTTNKCPNTETTTPLLSSYFGWHQEAMTVMLEECLYGIRGYVTDATSGTPIVANISIPSDKDHTDIYSGADYGDYYRLIAAGTYPVTYSAPGYVTQTIYTTVANGAATNQNVALVRATPVADFTADMTTTLDGKVVFTNTSTAMSSATWLWTFGDGTTSTDKNPVHYYSASGTYNVRLDLYSAAGNTYVSKNSYITVNALPAAPTCGTPASLCGSGSFALTASGGIIYNWYDAPTGGNLLYTGATYNTPTITTTTTYYVENEVQQSTQSAGMAYTATGATDQNTYPAEWYLKFDALQPIRLASVVVNAYATGTRYFDVYDDNNNLIASKAVNLTSTGQQTVNLDLVIPKGNDYKLGVWCGGTGTNTRLAYHTTGFSFPMTTSFVNIKGSFWAHLSGDQTPDFNTGWMYCYNWQVAPASARSVRTPVTCTITKVGVSIAADPGTNICSGNSVTFTATATNGGASPTYQWKVNGGNVGTNSSIYTSSSLVNNDVVTCVLTGNGACTSGSPATSNSLTMIVNGAVPSQPSAITGVASPCQGSTQSYNVTNVTGITYTWSAPGDWTILSGQGTGSISYVIGASSGTLSVTPSNGCGSGTARTLAVAPVAAPSQPSAITGSATPCQASSQTYSVTNVAGITYSWNLPSDWVITSGQGTNSITVTVGSVSGMISVVPVNANSCSGAEQTITVTVTPMLSQISTISGPATPLAASTQTYSVTNVPGITYTWAVPGVDWTITGGQNTYSITVTVGTTSGNITVTPSSICGTGSATTLAVAPTAAGSDRYSRATGNWNNTTTVWALTPTGTAGNYVPVAGNNVYIQSGNNITVNVASACSSIDIGSGGTLTIGSGFTLTVNGDVTGAGTIATSTTGIRTINLKGNWNYTGAFTGSYFYFTPTGTSDQIISSNSNLSCRVFTLNKASGTLYIAKSPTISTTTTLTAGNVNYCGGDQTLMNATHPGNVTISGSGTKTISAARTITGNFDVQSGTSFNTGPGTSWAFTVSGATILSGTLTLSGAGTKTFTGNVTINPGGVWSETGIASVGFAGNLQNDATSYTASSGTHTFTGASKNISGSRSTSISNMAVTGSYTNNGSVNVSNALSGAGSLTNGTTGILYLGGTSTITTLTANTSGNLVCYNGTAQTVNPITYHHLTLSGSGTKTTTGITVNGILSMEGNGTVTASVVPTYIASSTIQYKGTAAQTTGVELPATFSGSGGVVVDNIRGVSLSSSTAISNGLNIVNGAFTVGPNINLTVGGTTTLGSAQCLVLRSDATGSASFMDNGISGTGTAKVEKYLTNGRWWYVGAPLNNATAAAFGTLSASSGNGNRLFYWNEPGQSYVNVISTSDAMPAMRGYSFRAYGGSPITATYTGALNTGSIGSTTNLTYTSGSSSGYNLVSNPYPSGLNWGCGNTPTAGLTMTNLSTSIWYRVDGNWATYNWSGAGSGGNGGTKDIPAMQAFWVLVNSGPTGGLQVANTAREHTTQAFYKLNSEENVFRMQVEQDSLTDEIVVTFYPDATMAYDPYDSYKMFASDSNYPQIFMSLADGSELIINGLPEITAGSEYVVPLGFTTYNGGTFTFNATNMEDFLPDVSVYLEDAVMEHLYDLRQSNIYTFTSGVVNSSDRFLLHFNRIVTGTNENALTDNVYSYENSVYVNTPDAVSNVEMYDMLGNLIVSKQTTKGLNRIQANVSKGVYIVKVQNGNDVLTKKILIN